MAEGVEVAIVSEENMYDKIYTVKATDFCPITDGIACP